MSDTILNVDHLVVDYDHVHAIRDISLHVDRNEIVCLIGSNGAGKTSTLGAISNIVRKRSGTVTFESKNITDMHPANIVQLGISHVPEGRHVFPKMTVQENLILGTMAQAVYSGPDGGDVLPVPKAEGKGTSGSRNPFGRRTADAGNCKRAYV